MGKLWNGKILYLKKNINVFLKIKDLFEFVNII